MEVRHLNDLIFTQNLHKLINQLWKSVEQTSSVINHRETDDYDPRQVPFGLMMCGKNSIQSYFNGFIQ